MDLTRRPIYRLARASAFALALIAWGFFAPVQVGGHASYVIVSGISMKPVFHRGDLVILRTAAAYQVGDIVTYRHPTLGAVIHRIVEIEDGRFVLKGDNNTWLDDYRPAQADVIGKLWLYLPSAGRILEKLRQPWAIALLTALTGIAIAFPTTEKPMRRKGGRWRRRAASRQIEMSHSSSASKSDVLSILAVIAVASLMLGLFAFTRPVTRDAAAEISYQHTGQFSYSAAAPPGLYEGDTIKTGEPIFSRMISRVGVNFDYHLRAEGLGDCAGTARLAAVLTGSNGWRWTFELRPETSFRGSATQVNGVLDLAGIQAMLDSVEQQTGVSASQYTLTIVPTVAVSGTIETQAVQETFAPQLVFRLDRQQLQLASDQGSATTGPDPLNPVEQKSLRRMRMVPNRFAIFGMSVAVTTARMLAVVGLVLALLGAVGVALIAQREGGDSEAARINARFNSLMISVRDADLLTGRRVMHVAAIEDLARIAERNGQTILHEQRADAHLYVVQDGDVAYCYRPAQSSPAALADEGTSR